MGKLRSRRDANLRQHLAYLAARLVAEDGADFGSAKQKAARQAGLGDLRLLPDNDEIEAALREYQGLYQADEQPAQLRHMREIAVRVMRELEAFRPALVGPVLTGTAGRHSEVSLQLFPDDPKAPTLHFLNRRVRFEEGARRLRRGDGHVEVPQIRLQVEGVPVTLTILDRDEPRGRSREEADAPRARLAEVEALLSASERPASE